MIPILAAISLSASACSVAYVLGRVHRRAEVLALAAERDDALKKARRALGDGNEPADGCEQAYADAVAAGLTGSCRLYDDGTGGTVLLHGDEPLDDEGQEAFRQVIAAARRRFEAEHGTSGSDR